jgi:hypothetical protein
VKDAELDLPVEAGVPRGTDQAGQMDAPAPEPVAEGRPQPPGPRSDPPGDKPMRREPADRDFTAAAGKVEAAEAAGANVSLPPLAPAPPAPPVPGAAADPSPQVAGDPALAEAVAVVAKLPFAIDLLPSAAILEGGLGRRRRGSIDLGPCSPEAAACLEITLAQPAQQDRESEVALQVVAAELAEDGWSIRRIESGIDGEAVGVPVLIPFDFRAPVDQQFNAMLGRKVFQHLPPETEVLTAQEFGRRLRPANNMPPVLPTALKDQKFRDVIMVSVIVTPEGWVINPELDEIPANPALAGPALLTAALTRYDPPRKNRQPVYTRATVRVDFSRKPMPMDQPYWEMVDNEGTPFADAASGEVAPRILPYLGM